MSRGFGLQQLRVLTAIDERTRQPFPWRDEWPNGHTVARIEDSSMTSYRLLHRWRWYNLEMLGLRDGTTSVATSSALSRAVHSLARRGELELSSRFPYRVQDLIDSYEYFTVGEDAGIYRPGISWWGGRGGSRKDEFPVPNVPVHQVLADVATNALRPAQRISQLWFRRPGRRNLDLAELGIDYVADGSDWILERGYEALFDNARNYREIHGGDVLDDALDFMCHALNPPPNLDLYQYLTDGSMHKEYSLWRRVTPFVAWYFFGAGLGAIQFEPELRQALRRGPWR